jgi:Ca2+-binding RTX toxin-like protein
VTAAVSPRGVWRDTHPPPQSARRNTELPAIARTRSIGSDTADYFVVDGAAGVTADLANPFSNAGDAAGDSFASIENLHGSQWADVLRGDAGDNILIGLSGDDVLTGDAGNDTFTYRDSDGFDTITDFVAGAGIEDRIDVTGVAGVHTLADVLSFATQDGTDTLIDFGSGSIRLGNVVLATLHDDDFLFA